MLEAARDLKQLPRLQLSLRKLPAMLRVRRRKLVGSWHPQLRRK